MPFYLILAEYLLKHYEGIDVHHQLIADIGQKHNRNSESVRTALFELVERKLISDTGRKIQPARGRPLAIYRIRAARIADELAKHKAAERSSTQETIMTKISNRLSAALDSCTRNRMGTA